MEHEMHKTKSMNEVRDSLQGDNNLGQAGETIDSNTAITVPSRLQWKHSLLLKIGINVPYRPTTLEWLTQTDKSTMFKTRGR
jgi:hypothetical protein